MPIFAVPVVTTSSAPQSRVRFSSLPVRNKRKRTSSPTPSISDDDDDNDAKSQTRSEVTASTNPLSLTPAEVVQYRLAGLELDEEIPKTKGWPHRGLTADFLSTGGWKAKSVVRRIGKAAQPDNTSGEDSESEKDGGEGPKGRERADQRIRDEQPPSLRLQHLAVLIAILQRCLLQGDITRASRAWAMMVRSQVGGHAMDLRASGYWAVGAELLLRSGEKQPDISNVEDDAESVEDTQKDKKHNWESRRRYTTTAGVERAKGYYEQLILQHPYSRQHPESVSAMDFWPAMVGCEIYGIQDEQKESLRKLGLEEANEDEDEALEDDCSDQELGLDEGDREAVEFVAQERRKGRSRQKRAEQRWQKKDEIRRTALAAYEKLAARLDELLTTLPYSDSHTMLRLRGMLALCVGDTKVPSLLSDDEDREDDGDFREDRRVEYKRDAERRLLHQQRSAEHKRGKEMQMEERTRARQLFEKMERASGRKEAVTNSLSQEEDPSEDS